MALQVTNKSGSMIIDGIFASEAIDSSGEILDVEGCDISSLEAGDGTLNWEHKGSDEDATRNPNDHVGHVIYAKKIYKESDCDNDRQRKYWNEVKLPFIYGVIRLYDGSGQPGAIALAAQIRDHKINGEPILVRFSIEGSTLEKEGNRLVRSVARRVAATIKPCNKTCHADIISDPNSPFKTDTKKENELIEETLKNENPMYGRLSSYELQCDPEVTEEELTKTYTAGIATGAPGTLTGGAALQREDLKKKVVQVIKSFHDGTRKYSREAFREFLKNQLPEASEDFLDHFSDLVDDYHVKLRKDEAAPAVAAAPEPSPAPEQPAAKPKLAVVTKKPKKGKKEKELPYVPSSLPKPESPRPKGGAFKPVPFKGGEAGTSKDLATFDPNSGVLSFGTGKNARQFKADVSHEGWDEVLKDPKFVEMFDSIANNVKLVTDLRKKGVHLPGEFEIAAAMGGYSSNEQVPVQEAAIGHTIDVMGDKLPELSHRQPTIQEKRALQARFQSATLPKFGSGDSPENPDQWTKLLPTLALKNPKHKPGNPNSEPDPYKRDAQGQPLYRKIGKPRDKLGTLVFYHRMAPLLEELVKKHGTDGQAIANELIKKKEEWEKWKNKQRQEFDKGLKSWKKKRTAELEALGFKDKKLKARLSAEQKEQRKTYGNWGNVDEKLSYAGPIIEFLSNKTLRYMVGMLGATNVTVPDTHFTRHFFNQRLRDEGSAKDLTNIKNVLLNPLNAHVLNSIDEFHRKNHPAAQWVKNRYFGGQDDPAATFLGFWAHWMNIPKHEELTGRAPKTKKGETRGSDASNDDSTHASYFLHIAHQMKKYGIPGWEKFLYKSEEQTDPELAQMPMKDRIQLALSEIADQHGPEAASLAYFAMVPALYGEYQQQQQAAKVRHLQGMSVDLNSILSQFKAGGQQGFQPDVRSLIVNIDGKPRPVGRFLIHNGQLQHLEDYHGLLSKLLPEGPVNDALIKRMHAMASHPDIEFGKDRPVQPEQRVKEPMPDPLQDIPAQAPVPAMPTPRPPSVFEYTRAGHDEPHVLEVQNGTYLLDGNPLSYPEVALLVENIRSGAATLRYRVLPVQQQIAKMEALMKAVAYAPQPEEAADPQQMDIEQALQHVRNAVAAGQLHPSVADALTSHIYEDPMLAGSNIGNKFAYTQFRNKQKPGVYLSMDGNDFKSVNDKYGHDTGDEAIKAMGNTLRGALRDSVGDENGKLFRNGGDEFTAYFPSHEHAVRFARAVRDKFDQLPPIRDNHKLSMSIGIGHNPVMADSALYEAKKQKLQPGTLQRAFEPGQVPTLAHSMMPGNEGAIPLGNAEHAAVKQAISPMPTPPTAGEQPSVPTPSPVAPKQP